MKSLAAFVLAVGLGAYVCILLQLPLYLMMPAMTFSLFVGIKAGEDYV
jgi:hypothetical protein